MGLERFRQQSRQKWETFYFLAIWALLVIQLMYLQAEYNELHQLHPLVLMYVRVARFLVHIYGPPFFITELMLLLIAYSRDVQSRLARRIYDFYGVYYIIRMLIQFTGLNILVFDDTSSRFLLITQLIFFLPYSLLIWGWIYWRLDQLGRAHGRALFRLDHESEHPRVIDYFVASFSSVFSASISNIKGCLARSRVLILLHGVMIYDLMGLTLSRAVALVQR